ncbi:MAG: tetratricopeptide repeat protein [Myxococcales bacterium]|nr:tetratricopeptide repeat protein [Myxococcales bacterium]
MSLELKTRVDGPRAADAEASDLGDDTTEEGDADAGISRIGRFYVFRRLGEGGMGRVFLGYDDGLDRRVAIKLLHGRGADDVRTRMFREAQALARLSHPNVVQVYEVGDVDGRLYMAMEFVEGMTLRRWAQERTRPTAAIVERYVQSARGLAAAHRAGLLHRDFKPENAIVGEDGRVRVLDFGLARAEGSPIEAEESLRFRPTIRVSGGQQVLDAPVTVAGTVLGTPAYMPIEQLTGDATDGRSDQFSFCVALWEALHGVRPFDGKSLKELAAAIARGQPDEGPRSRAVPRRIRSALLRGLSAYPSERWPTMDDLIDALEGGARRRRWRGAAILGVAALALIVLALVSREWQEQRASAACERRGEVIATTWNPTIAKAIRDHAGASDRDFATTSARLLTTILDEYAAAWASARAEVCREVEVDAAWTPELGAEAEACLEESRRYFAELVDAGRRADPVQLQQLLPAALDLARIERCLDASWLARRPRAPEDPRAKAAIDEIDRDLAAVHWLEALGRVDEARPRARDLVARADALGWRPLAARARFVAGRLAEQRAPQEAAMLLREGFFLALESGEDRLAAEIASRQVVATGVDLGRADEGGLWGAWAQALIDREPTGRELLEGRLDAQLGILAQSQDDSDGAERYWRRALATWEVALGPGHPEVASILNNLGTLEHERERLDEARALWERALAIWQASLGPEHPKTAAVLVNLGLVAESQKHHDEALELTRRALAILEETLGHDDSRLLEPLRSIGRIERARGDLPASIAA